MYMFWIIIIIKMINTPRRAPWVIQNRVVPAGLLINGRLVSRFGDRGPGRGSARERMGAGAPGRGAGREWAGRIGTGTGW